MIEQTARSGDGWAKTLFMLEKIKIEGLDFEN